MHGPLNVKVCAFIYVNILTPQDDNHPVTVPRLDKKLAVFYRIRIFITVFTRARHLSWAR